MTAANWSRRPDVVVSPPAGEALEESIRELGAQTCGLFVPTDDGRAGGQWHTAFRGATAFVVNVAGGEQVPGYVAAQAQVAQEHDVPVYVAGDATALLEQWGAERVEGIQPLDALAIGGVAIKPPQPPQIET